jgi:hypothetical protein
LLPLKSLTKASVAWGGFRGLLTFKTIQALLNEHLGHVADCPGFGLSQGGEPFADLLGQDHLNSR